MQLPWAKAYLESWHGRPTPPRIGLSRIVYPAADKRTAQAQLEKGILRSSARMVKAGKFPAGLSTVAYFKRFHAFYGHPEEVAAELAADEVLPHITDLIVQFNPGVPSLDQALKAFELIATQVAPALGWQPRSERVAGIPATVPTATPELVPV